MAFKQAFTSLLLTVACCTVLSVATPLSYLSDNYQNGFPFGNQGSFTYLRDNAVNQAVYPLQSGPVNYINNIGSSQVQTIGPYPGVVSNVGLVGNNVYGSNIVSNVNGLSTIQYPTVAQTLPVYSQAVSYPYAVPVGGPVGYSNQANQITNTQSVPVEINYNSGSVGCR